ncbi:MAG: 2-C-methyl-D-erythritol 4-phosphate cytidylyltransferase [Clostridia bacterium]|nr:2-C-methyl-D-erythritol 4-phosphate cytidylyltransferase [Clostridia bacterium]MBQ8165106.1 2-C-methyl-D-erythritol 4-phosphate cytidylyltransferase [Clostridia bacterium]
MVFAVIVAGGIGSRMKSADIPKQFMELGDKPIIIHTVERFIHSERIDRIYIGVHPEWIDYMEELLVKHFGNSDVAVIVPGGKDRNGTVFNVIDRIEADYGLSDEHIVLTHDAVRPFITQKIINENIDAAVKYGAAGTAYNSIDTIVMSGDGEFITSVPERRMMYNVQTPQSFKINLLRQLFDSLSQEEKNTLTDACRICTVRNQPVYIVEGDISNIKITTPTDFKFAQVIADSFKE